VRTILAAIGLTLATGVAVVAAQVFELVVGVAGAKAGGRESDLLPHHGDGGRNGHSVDISGPDSLCASVKTGQFVDIRWP
jgi:hypothetical protein